VASRGGKITDYDIDEALNMKKTIDEELINIGKILAL
jgi:6-phosphofructokinase 1